MLSTVLSLRSIRFDPRPRAGGDSLFSQLSVTGTVSIHAPARGATNRYGCDPAELGVSIHAPARGATRGSHIHSSFLMFRSTPPRGGRRRSGSGATWQICFDPRPRAGGDPPGGARPLSARVSIHAPARGATVYCRQHCRRSDVSIHAPARGATTFQRFKGAVDEFRSTPPRGGRLYIVASIADDRMFRSTPPRGGRPVRDDGAPQPGRFDPRPRAGGDPRRGTRRCTRRCFDPRPRAGGDATDRGSLPVADVSIHAPARGATRGCRTARTGCQFRSTPPRGGRRDGASPQAHPSRFDPRPRAGGDDELQRREPQRPVSIHAPARGATRPPRESGLADGFRSTPPRGGRPSTSLAASVRALVSIHAPARGATTRPLPEHRHDACFDPRPRAGGDLLFRHQRVAESVSIHAPARGAT